MADLSSNKTIFTLNVNSHNMPSKVRQWQNEFKKLVQPNAVYKKLISNSTT